MGNAPRAAASGVVKIDGRPLTKGIVRFVPIEGTAGPKTGIEVSAGMFSADAVHGPVVGKHRIEIESTEIAGVALDDEEAMLRLVQQGGPPDTAMVVPDKYGVRSKLTETVTAEGPNDFLFELTTD